MLQLIRVLSLAAAVLVSGALQAAEPVRAPLRIVIAGDSTASPYEQSRYPRMGWGQVLDRFVTPDVTVVNRAVSGRSTKSYVDLGHFATTAAELRRGDLFLIQFGHNDGKRDDPARYTEPRNEFPAGLRRFVEAARKAGAQPVLLTPVARRVFDAEGRVVDTHGPYREAVIAVAQAEKVPLIDLGRRSQDWVEALGPEASKAYFLHDASIALEDDTHFHERGASAVACLVAGELVAQQLLAKERTTRDLDCGVPLDQRARHAKQKHPSVIQHGDAIASVQVAPHGGAGVTVAAPFFRDVPDLDLVFRRRTLHVGASIGLHAHGPDEVYYVLSGHGEFSLDGKVHIVGPGTAMLTRDGSTHTLRQIGSEDLTILIVYRPTSAHP